MGLLRRSRKEQVVIDLRDHVEKASTPEWGSPVPCPSCEGRGYLDHIDPFREVMYLHCVVCGERYEITRAQLEQSRAG